MALFRRNRRLPIFYTLPAWAITKGMSTRDGLYVNGSARRVCDQAMYEVCAPGQPDKVEYLTVPARDRVQLAVFEGTEVDGSSLPDAVIDGA